MCVYIYIMIADYPHYANGATSLELSPLRRARDVARRQTLGQSRGCVKVI